MNHKHEYNQRLIDDIIEIISNKKLPVLFDSPVIVKKSPHTEICRCYGCLIDGYGNLSILNPENKWEVLNANQANVAYVLQSIYQRLKMLYPKKDKITKPIIKNDKLF